MDGVTPLGAGTADNARRFAMHECIGRGGHGEVYRATMTRPGGVSTEVALKVLAADVDPNSDPVHRLKDEGRLLGALSHPALLKVYDLVLLDGRVALATEFVDGQDLHRCIYSDAGVPPRVLVELVGQVAEALHTAWTASAPDGRGPMRLVHRDIKPQNVRIGRHGEVKLLDFGIARAVNDVHRESQTQNDILMGSWPYLAPERMLEVPGPLTSAVDVYGLGCLLFEGLAKQRLMEGQSLFGLYRLVDQPGSFGVLVQSRIEALSRRVPADLRTLMHRLLAEDPSQRPTAYQAATLCEEVAEGMTGMGLRRWARERSWPDPSTDRGPLTGRELTEGRLDLARPGRVVGGQRPLRASAGWIADEASASVPSLPAAQVAASVPHLGASPRVSERSPIDAAGSSRPPRADPRAPTLRRWEGPAIQEPRAPSFGLPSVAGITIDHEGRRMAPRPTPAPPALGPRRMSPPLITFALFGVGLGLFIMAGVGLWWILSGAVPILPLAQRAEGLAPREITVPGTHAIEAAPAVADVIPPEPAAVPEPKKAPPTKTSRRRATTRVASAPAARSTRKPAPVPVAPAPLPEPPEPQPVADRGPAPDSEPPPILDSRDAEASGEGPAVRGASVAEPASVAPGTTGELSVQGDATVELLGEFGGFRIGTPLVPGTYQVWADFGDGLVDTGLTTRVGSGGDRVTVSCSMRARRCFVSPRVE